MSQNKEDFFRPGITSPVSSMSIVIGDAVKSRCNGHCNFCISRCTHAINVESNTVDQHLVNWNTVMPKFHAACRFAKTSGVTNIILTGRGEPTLYASEIQHYLKALHPYQFPFIELQTNGLLFESMSAVETLEYKRWNKLGLSHIAISIAHWSDSKNREIYNGDGSIKSATRLSYFHKFSDMQRLGFSTRACLVLMKDYVDSVKDFNFVVDSCKSVGVRQLRIAALGKPAESENKAVEKWIDNHMPEHTQEIIDHIVANGHYLRTLPHGAPIFDYNGLSVCIADCMPKQNQVGNGMQPIFWPDGSLTYSWEWKGAVLL